MNKPYLKHGFICAILCISVLFVLHSCKKEGQTNPIIRNEKLSEAKLWYENAFPLNPGKSAYNLGINGGNIDFSQLIGPDWQQAANYTRYGDDVFEIPITAPEKFGITLKDATGNKIYNKKFSRTSFLLLKNVVGYKAYIMVIIGDSSYVNNNFEKLDNNYYNKHEPDFSGVLLYYTPKGQLLHNWQYKDGKIISNYLSNQTTDDVTGMDKTTQGLKKTNPYVDICTDFYTRAYIDGAWTSWSYSYTSCRSQYYSEEEGLPSAGGGGSAGSSGGNNGSSNNPPLPYNPCNPTATGTNAYKTFGNAPYEPGPSDGGFPPPTETSPCPTTPNPIPPIPTDTTMTDEFYQNDKIMCALRKLMTNNFYKNTLNNFIGETKPIDISFKLEPIAEDPGFINYGRTNVNPTTWSSTNMDLIINSNRVDNMSSLQVASTLLHEGIHAEIYRKLLLIHGPENLNGVNFPSMFKMYEEYSMAQGFPHEYMANYYIDIMANALRQFDNNSFDLSYYKDYAWQGLESTDSYKAKSPAEQAAIQNNISTLLAGRSTQGCSN